MISFRILNEIEELEQIVSLETAVWGLNPRDAVPAAILHVVALNGGLVLGAYDDTKLVGAAFCMPVKRGSDVFLWSHMTGIHQQYQRNGIGLDLKRFQRRWALDNGYRSIGWTFDPLQRGNAWFNLHLLGTDAAMIAATYHVNFYGEMDDEINRGMPSDRIEVRWQLDQPSLHDATPREILLVRADARGYPLTTESDWTADAYGVAVPADLDALRKTDRAAALAWRLAVREALLPAFQHGYGASDFTRSGGLYLYHLRRLEP